MNLSEIQGYKHDQLSFLCICLSKWEYVNVTRVIFKFIQENLNLMMFNKQKVSFSLDNTWVIIITFLLRMLKISYRSSIARVPFLFNW